MNDEFDYNKDMLQYKTSRDVYFRYPLLQNLNANEIVKIGLKSSQVKDYEFASACRALMLLDKDKFKP